MCTMDPMTGKKNRRIEPLMTLKKTQSGYYPFVPKDSNDYKKEAFFAIHVNPSIIESKSGNHIHIGDIGSIF